MKNRSRKCFFLFSFSWALFIELLSENSVQKVENLLQKISEDFGGHSGYSAIDRLSSTAFAFPRLQAPMCRKK